ncbi:MAG: hypothetical protein RJB37_421 [Pseudomonadota bacterium]|jgi:hypothetical protein
MELAVTELGDEKKPEVCTSGSIHLWRRVEETTVAWECLMLEKF